MTIHLIGGKSDKDQTDLEYIRCPLCGEKTTMMEHVGNRGANRTWQCIRCKDDFDQPYLVAFWRGFEIGKLNATKAYQQQVQDALVERASANRMIWAVAYNGKKNRIKIPDNIMAMAGDPAIIIEAHRDPAEIVTVIKARFATNEERKQMGLPEEKES